MLVLDRVCAPRQLRLPRQPGSSLLQSGHGASAPALHNALRGRLQG